MGQSDTVNQLPDSAQLLNQKLNVVKKRLVESSTPSLWKKSAYI